MQRFFPSIKQIEADLINAELFSKQDIWYSAFDYLYLSFSIGQNSAISFNKYVSNALIY